MVRRTDSFPENKQQPISSSSDYEDLKMSTKTVARPDSAFHTRHPRAALGADEDYL